MKSDAADATPVAHIAAAIAEPARTRMLYCLMDGHARTSTELAAVAEVSASTASVHLKRLAAQRLVKVSPQGRYHYYSLQGPSVAAALEALTVLAGTPPARFEPNTPPRLRAARTCYDHMAGAVAVSLHECCLEHAWLTSDAAHEGDYLLTPDGTGFFASLGIDLDAIHAQRRRFACACLDWSERRPHLAGALGAALLHALLKRRWVTRDLDSRALRLTASGKRELAARFGIPAESLP
ncbi:MAG TPA: helix-turn-helix transcriptional regulator [Gammaproteobacteria bacterium]|jgi:DNA-binding transcriptional ArsR family regulator